MEGDDGTDAEDLLEMAHPGLRSSEPWSSTGNLVKVSQDATIPSRTVHRGSGRSSEFVHSLQKTASIFTRRSSQRLVVWFARSLLDTTPWEGGQCHVCSQLADRSTHRSPQ